MCSLWQRNGIANLKQRKQNAYQAMTSNLELSLIVRHLKPFLSIIRSITKKQHGLCFLSISFYRPNKNCSSIPTIKTTIKLYIAVVVLHSIPRDFILLKLLSCNLNSAFVYTTLVCDSTSVRRRLI